MRPPARLLLTGAALVVAASCANDAVAPNRDAAPVISGNPALRALSSGRTTDFVIPAAGGQVSILGMYTLNFPANSVCDPAAGETTDGYNAQSWDADCPAATGDIAVTAKLKWSYGRLWVDFSPAIRFVPSQTVTIQTDILAPLVRHYGASAMANGMARSWGINYATDIEGKSFDESRTDATLRTTIDGTTGRISRRIKHFSGYQIYTGESCVPSGPEDTSCVWVEDPIWKG